MCLFLIVDEDMSGSEPNTISLRREIPITDFNDNPPVFKGRPYSARISEAAEVGSEVKVVPQIVISDKDGGINSDIQVFCNSKNNLGDTEACEVFSIQTEKVPFGAIASV